jgi:hypothetical protein
MKQVISALAFLLLFAATGRAQVTIDSTYTYKAINKSLSFAQLTFGGDILGTSGGHSTLNGVERSFGPGFQPRITIGGLHFWGHVDFYVSFPLGITAQSQPKFADKLKNIEGVETGMKIYPVAIRPGRISPYVGISFQPYQLQYRMTGFEGDKGPATYNRFITPVQAGLTYATKKLLFTAGVRYNWRNNFSYFESPVQKAAIQLKPIGFSLAVLGYIDTDKGMGSARSVRQLNIMHYILDKHKRLDSWYWGIGPSSALQLSKSSFLKSKYPYLAEESFNSFLIPDLSFGRYFSKADLNVGVSARSMFFKADAFDTRLRFQRHTIGLEVYKFLFNYHGFVPFVGPMLSIEYLRMDENGTKAAESTKPAAGIVFGWDIRVTKTGTSLLRTNLRYAPGLHLETSDGNRVMFDHLEFNFIQYVTFIGRRKLYRQYSKK